jgi:hypothetical protein
MLHGPPRSPRALQCNHRRPADNAQRLPRHNFCLASCIAAAMMACSYLGGGTDGSRRLRRAVQWRFISGRIMRYLVLLSAVTFFLGSSVQPAAAAPLRRVIIDVQNPTSRAISFTSKTGGDDWVKRAIKPGYTQRISGFDPLYVSFDNGQRRTTKYRMAGGSTNYFNWSHGRLDLLKR